MMMMIVGLIVAKMNLVKITEHQGMTMMMIMRTIDADGEVGVTSVGNGDNELK